MYKINIFSSLFSKRENQYIHIYKSQIMADSFILLSIHYCCSLYSSPQFLFWLNIREISF